MHCFSNWKCIGRCNRLQTGSYSSFECNTHESRFPRLWRKGGQSRRSSSSANIQNDHQGWWTSQSSSRQSKELMISFDLDLLFIRNTICSSFNISKKIGPAQQWFRPIHRSSLSGLSIHTIRRRKCLLNLVLSKKNWIIFLHSLSQ